MAEGVRTDLFGAVCRDLERLTIEYFEEIAPWGGKTSSQRYATIDEINEPLQLHSSKYDDIAKTYSVLIKVAHPVDKPEKGMRFDMTVHGGSGRYICIVAEPIRSSGELNVEDFDLLRGAAEGLAARVREYVEGNRTHTADVVGGATNLIELESYKGLSVLKESSTPTGVPATGATVGA